MPILIQTLVSRSALIFILLSIILLAPGCTHLFFKPTKELVINPAILKYSPSDVYFRSSDGLTLHGWYFRAREERGTILICHGNVENLSTHVMLDLWLIDAGYNLFIFDYRGYGRSEGSPDVKGIQLDAEAALETLLFTLPRAKYDNIIIFGKSLGGAVAVYTVANSPHKYRVKALILDSVFSSYRAIAREKISDSIIGWPFQYPLSLLINDDFSPINYVHRIAPVPIVIIHGRADDIVPEHHGRQLYDAALLPREFWVPAMPGHVRAQADEGTRKKLLNYLSLLP
ncbi:MAG: alpha/beta hydrolase [Nitrospirae bacterium]|nr:alpha/beta hydrolase [Nitrospirota bacterium]